MKQTTKYTFWWSPEGRPLATIEATSLPKAYAQFKREYPAYAKYKGEIYWTTGEAR